MENTTSNSSSIPGKTVLYFIVLVISLMAFSFFARMVREASLRTIKEAQQQTACMYLCSTTTPVKAEAVLPESALHGPRCLCENDRVVSLKYW